MNITIRKATAQDFPAIMALIRELAVFQKMSEKVNNSVERMEAEKDFFDCFVAVNDEEKVVGMAIFFFAYFTWAGKSLYLDDLYVQESCRGQRIGSRLLEMIFETARETGCHRVRWQVSEWNKAAVKFYQKCGAEMDMEIYNCDFNEEAILEFRPW